MAWRLGAGRMVYGDCDALREHCRRAFAPQHWRGPGGRAGVTMPALPAALYQRGWAGGGDLDVGGQTLSRVATSRCDGMAPSTISHALSRNFSRNNCSLPFVAANVELSVFGATGGRGWANGGVDGTRGKSRRGAGGRPRTRAGMAGRFRLAFAVTFSSYTLWTCCISYSAVVSAAASARWAPLLLIWTFIS